MANTDERIEILRDHFEECFKHFAARFNAKKPPGTKGRSKCQRPVAKFCGVGEQTIQHWLVNAESINVGGITEIKLKCFLDMIGYRIIEFERLPTVLRNFAELLGFGIISSKDATERLGYTHIPTLYSVLSQKGKGSGYSNEKAARMFDLWKERRNELEHVKKDAARHYRLDFLNSTPTLKPILMPSPAVTGNVAVRRVAVLTLFDALLMLLREGLFDELSESELATLREVYGSTIIELSGHFMNLRSRIVAVKEEG